MDETIKISKGLVRRLVEAFAALGQNDCLSYNQIEQIIGKNPQGEGRSACNLAIKRVSKKHGVLIRNLRNVGYYRASTGERPEYAETKRSHADRTYQDGLIAVSIIEANEFQNATQEELQVMAAEQTRIGLPLLISRHLDKKKDLPRFKFSALEDFSHVGNIFVKRMESLKKK